MSQSTLVFVTTLIALFGILIIIDNRRYRRRIRALAAVRSGESICQFARSLPFRQLDTAVIRLVYEAIQAQVSVADCRIPIRTTDDCSATLNIDPEDLEYLVHDVARRCGRTLDGCEQNPFYGRVRTAGDLVHFLCAQPKLNE